MSLYQVWVNDVPLIDPENGIGVDRFDGRRTIAPPRLYQELTVGPGINTIPGPPEEFPFGLEFWVAGETQEELEERIDTALRPFQHTGRPIVVAWESLDGQRREAPCAVVSTEPLIEHTSSFARFKVTLMNLEGAWRDSVTHETVASPSESILPPGDSTATIWDASLSVTGPATNPEFRCGDAHVRYVGALAPGQTLTLRSYPTTATLNPLQLGDLPALNTDPDFDSGTGVVGVDHPNITRTQVGSDWVIQFTSNGDRNVNLYGGYTFLNGLIPGRTYAIISTVLPGATGPFAQWVEPMRDGKRLLTHTNRVNAGSRHGMLQWVQPAGSTQVRLASMIPQNGNHVAGRVVRLTSLRVVDISTYSSAVSTWFERGPNSQSVVRDLRYVGSGPRLLDIPPSTPVSFSATGVTSETSWSLRSKAAYH